jgi:hypothetical protein
MKRNKHFQIKFKEEIIMLNETEKAMMDDLYEAFDRILESKSYDLIACLCGSIRKMRYEAENTFDEMFEERRKGNKA